MAEAPTAHRPTASVEGLRPDTALAATTWCVLREQPHEYLAYNARTDELHLLSPSARYLYLLCDGLNTVRDIQEMAPGGSGDVVPAFLGELVARGLLAPITSYRLEASS